MRYTNSDIGQVEYSVVQDIELNGVQFEVGDVITLSDITEKAGGTVIYTFANDNGSFTIAESELGLAGEFEEV